LGRVLKHLFTDARCTAHGGSLDSTWLKTVMATIARTAPATRALIVIICLLVQRPNIILMMLSLIYPEIRAQSNTGGSKSSSTTTTNKTGDKCVVKRDLWFVNCDVSTVTGILDVLATVMDLSTFRDRFVFDCECVLSLRLTRAFASVVETEIKPRQVDAENLKRDKSTPDYIVVVVVVVVVASVVRHWRGNCRE